MDPVRLDVATPSRPYAITIGDGILDRLPALLDEAGTPARRFVVSSPLVWRLHGARLAAAGLPSRSSCRTASGSSSCRRSRASTTR